MPTGCPFTTLAGGERTNRLEPVADQSGALAGRLAAGGVAPVGHARAEPAAVEVPPDVVAHDVHSAEPPVPGVDRADVDQRRVATDRVEEQAEEVDHEVAGAEVATDHVV